jgi:hypothetical protein
VEVAEQEAMRLILGLELVLVMVVLVLLLLFQELWLSMLAVAVVA